MHLLLRSLSQNKLKNSTVGHRSRFQFTAYTDFFSPEFQNTAWLISP